MSRKATIVLLMILLLIITLTACNAGSTQGENLQAGENGLVDDFPTDEPDDVELNDVELNDDKPDETDGITPDFDSNIVPNNLWEVTDGITLRLAQDSYPPGTTNMTLILENRSESVMMYAQGWSFEKYENGEWRELRTKDNYGFIDLGYILYNYDVNTFPIWADFLSEPFDEGLYRVTGCSPMVWSSLENHWSNEGRVTYPPYQLEFTISETAQAEPGDLAEKPLSASGLREKEDWQWYRPWEFEEIYSIAGKQTTRIAIGENGLVAILFSKGPEPPYPGDLLLMDIFDRKTGKQYEVFTEPTIKHDVDTDMVSSFNDGFNDGFLVDCDNLLFCFIDSYDYVIIIGFETDETTNDVFADVDDLQFSDLAGVEFWFGSGVGAWSTIVNIEPDGTFTGYFHDSDMGDDGDDYPHGTLYECYFSGRFSPLRKSGDYEYSMICEALTSEGTFGEEKIVNGFRRITSTPYGFDNANEFLLYLPGKKADELPEAYLSWSQGMASSGVLTCYGLYNVGGEQGFIQ